MLESMDMFCMNIGCIDVNVLVMILLQKPVLEKPSTTLRKLENSGLLHRRAQRS